VLSLSDEEALLVERAVRALVEHDRPTLEEMGAYDDGADPYLWTRDYGRWGEVDLVMPPGPVRDWSVDGQRNTEEGAVMLDVDLWTAQEGRSDLTLSLQLNPAEAQVRIEDLHVL
jgi:hypothetical protein